MRTDGTSQVIIEQDAGAGLQTIAEWQVVSGDPLQPWETVVECPSGFQQEAVDALAVAAANAGNCLRSHFLHAEAANMAAIIATRSFLINCRRGTNAAGGGAAAGIHLESVSDPIRAIIFVINLDWWATAQNREPVLAHELMHGSFLARHDPTLNALRDSDRRRWRELDRVESCERLCYDPLNATKCECATCRGAKTCGSCANLKDCASDQLKAYCTCETRPNWYMTKTDCEIGCKSGLSCAFSSCRDDGNVCK